MDAIDDKYADYEWIFSMLGMNSKDIGLRLKPLYNRSDITIFTVIRVCVPTTISKYENERMRDARNKPYFSTYVSAREKERATSSAEGNYRQQTSSSSSKAIPPAAGNRRLQQTFL